MKRSIFITSSRGYQWVVLLNVIFTGISGSMSASAGYIANSTLRGALHLSLDQLRWVSISYVMMLGIILPLGMYLAERYGYKLLFLTGILIFLIGSVINTLATGFISILISRSIAGTGAGILFPLSIAVIYKVFSKTNVTIALTLYIGFVFGIGSGLGLCLGGYIVEHISWKAPFVLCSLLGLASICITWLIHEETEKKKGILFDGWGYGTFIVFISCILLILNSGKAQWNTRGWDSPFMWYCYLMAIISLFILIPIELRHPKPLFVFHLFTKKSFFLGCFAVFLVGGALYSSQQQAVDFLDNILKYEKQRSAFLLIPIGLALGTGSVCSTMLSRIIPIRTVLLIGIGIVSLSCLMHPNITLYSDHKQILSIWITKMVGIGFTLGPATTLAISEVTPQFAGAAATLITLFRQIGGTICSLWTEVIVIERNVFHQEIFGTQINPDSPVYRAVVNRLHQYLSLNGGSPPNVAQSKAAEIIRDNVAVQAHVTAIGDAFFLMGIVASICTVALFMELLWSFYKKNRKNFKPSPKNEIKVEPKLKTE